MEELVQQGNCNLGMSLMKLGEREKAEDSFAQSSKGPNPKVIIKSFYWLAKCNLEKGDFKKAEVNLEKLKGFGENTK
jgi:TolA-binding protein